MPEDFTTYPKLKRAEYHPKVENGVIIEIGTGWRPLPLISESVVSRIRNNALYIGIDKERRHLEGYARHAAGQFICSNLFNLPLVDGLADQIWLMNVVGEKGIEEPLAESAFGELRRILKPSGAIIVGEFYTPGTAAWLLDYDFQTLGFQREVFSTKRGRDFIRKHGILERISKVAFGPKDTDTFFMTLTRAA